MEMRFNLDLNKRLHEIFFRFPENFPLPFVLDGATGTALMKLGMPSGACIEIFITEHPEKINQIQNAYVKCGANAILAPTFGANRAVMKRHHIAEGEVDPLNKALVSISKKSRCLCASCSDPSLKSDILIGADLSPTGYFIEPFGETRFESVVDIYREQAKSLMEAGVDFFITETNISLQEARAAVIAIRELDADIPVFVTLSVDERGRTMSGDSLEAAVLALGSLRVNAFGTNCSTGPAEMIKVLAPVVKYAAAMGIPVIAKPNAGVPRKDENGNETFSLTSKDMEKFIPEFFGCGIFILGGCCGTDEEYIASLRKYADSLELSESNIAAAIKNLPVIENLASNNRTIVSIENIDLSAAEFIMADDDFYDNISECEDDFVCIDLGVSGADIFLENIAYITLPVVIRGEKSQIDKVSRVYNGNFHAVYS